jgi:regulatory protein
LITEIVRIDFQPWSSKAGSRLPLFKEVVIDDMGRVVTGLKAQKKNHQRVNIYLDGEFAFGLSRFVAAWLRIGQEIDQEKIESLLAEDAREVAYQQALNFLRYRERSKAEVRNYLARQDIPEVTIEEIISRLQERNLIDDQRFARLWAENRADFHPRSRRVISLELRQKGVPNADIDQAISQVDDDELAYQAALKYAGKLGPLSWQEFRQKLFGYLSRRGFNYETTTQATQRAWTERNSPSENSILYHEEVDT